MTKNILCEHPTSVVGSPRKVNVMEFEISSIPENDGNVEKAEAYAKELEDVSKLTDLLLRHIVFYMCFTRNQNLNLSMT